MRKWLVLVGLVLLGVALLGCTSQKNETATLETCGGITIYNASEGCINYDTPFLLSKCTIGSKNVTLTFKKNCTLTFKKIDFFPKRRYIHIVAKSDGNVTYVFKTKNNSTIVVSIGNKTITGTGIVMFNASGMHEFTIRWH